MFGLGGGSKSSNDAKLRAEQYAAVRLGGSGTPSPRSSCLGSLPGPPNSQGPDREFGDNPQGSSEAAQVAAGEAPPGYMPNDDKTPPESDDDSGCSDSDEESMVRGKAFRGFGQPMETPRARDQLEAMPEGEVLLLSSSELLESEIKKSENLESNEQNKRMASVSTAGLLQPTTITQGFGVFVTSAFLATLQASRREEDASAKVVGYSVIVWVINGRGEPVGTVGVWPAKRGLSPVWNSAKALRGMADWENYRLCIELWEQLEGGVRVQLAGPAVLPLTNLPLESTRIEIPRRRCQNGVVYLHAQAMASNMVKQVFLIRHGESKWNAAKKAKRYDKMMKEHDHPLNEKGYKQVA